MSCDDWLKMNIRKQLEETIYQNGKLITSFDIDEAREKYLNEQEKETGDDLIKYEYASILVKSNNHENKLRGISLMEDLVEKEYKITDCMYSIALAYYALGEYRKCRKLCERLIRINPDNKNVLIMHQCLQSVIHETGPSGIGIIAGIAITTGFVIGALLKKRI